jgi:hypothetical protein
VSFAANERSKVIRINVKGDNTVEPDKTFLVTLSIPATACRIDVSEDSESEAATTKILARTPMRGKLRAFSDTERGTIAIHS